MSVLNKSIQVFDAWLDNRLEKATTNTPSTPDAPSMKDAAYDRRSLIEIEYGTEQQWGWKEKRGLVGNGVLKNMARKDSIVASIIQTRQNQVSQFSQPQKDRYSPGFKIIPKTPADLSRTEKLQLSDPALTADDEMYKQKKFELEQKMAKEQDQQDEDVDKITKFIIHCGLDEHETDTTYRRCDFDRCVKLWVWDRLVYNYAAAETVPNKVGDALHHWYPVSAGTIKYVSKRSANRYKEAIKQALDGRTDRLTKDLDLNESDVIEESYDNVTAKSFRYVQVIRGRVEAAWTEDEFIFEAGNPTIDPEDNGYAPGELERLISIVTAHLYAEAHNRNYFTQGIGTKGLLHIKGENISRAQLEGFKRQWFNQLASSRNAFRPPIIGLADEVKWIELAKSNQEMEFEKWMNYLIRVMCAVYQIDPAEINFDISKLNTSTLNESSNEARLKSSKDKGLTPLLNFIENIINRQILPRWDKELALKYEFKFVGLNAETRVQEQERLEKETKVWKTLNEARVDMGKAPIEDGDVVLNATYTQFLQMKLANEQMDQGGMEGEEDANLDEESNNMANEDMGNLEKELGNLEKEAKDEIKAENDEKEKKQQEADKKEADKASAKKKPEETKKANPTVIEYYIEDDKDED